MSLKGQRAPGPLARLKQAITDSLTGSTVAQSMASTVGIKAGQPLPIGIDFGASALKVLQLAPTNPPQLVAAAALDTPEELLNDPDKRLTFQLEALPKLIKHAGMKGRRAVCVLPAWRTFVKPLQIARQDGIDTNILVQSAIQTQLNCDPLALVYRFYEIRGGDKAGARSEVLVIAAARDLVDRLMRGLANAKLEPVGMHSEFAATLRAFDYIHKREGDLHVNTLYLDIGATSTKLIISHSTELAFARVIDMGGRKLDEAICRFENISPENARKRRISEDSIFAGIMPTLQTPVPLMMAAAANSETHAAEPTPEERREQAKQALGFTGDVLAQPAAKMSPECKELADVLETLTDEVRMCLRYHAAQFPNNKVERAVFVGGEARHRALCQHIARTLRLPAQTADPMARVARTGSEPAFGVDFKQPQPGWAVALGLCLAPTDL